MLPNQKRKKWYQMLRKISNRCGFSSLANLRLRWGPHEHASGGWTLLYKINISMAKKAHGPVANKYLSNVKHMTSAQIITRKSRDRYWIG